MVVVWRRRDPGSRNALSSTIHSRGSRRRFGCLFDLSVAARAFGARIPGREEDSVDSNFFETTEHAARSMFQA